MKKIFLFVLIISICSCKKNSSSDPSPTSSTPIKDFTINTYLGFAGFKKAYDTIVSGTRYDTFNYSKPVVFFELDSTKVDIYKGSALISSGYTDSNGEYKVSGFESGYDYSISYTTKSFITYDGKIYHYSSKSSFGSDHADALDYYYIHLGAGIGHNDGIGSTNSVHSNPWTE